VTDVDQQTALAFDAARSAIALIRLARKGNLVVGQFERRVRYGHVWCLTAPASRDPGSVVRWSIGAGRLRRGSLVWRA
jgi:hypothetical protein